MKTRSLTIPIVICAAISLNLGCVPRAFAQPVGQPSSVTRAGSGQAGLWKLRSRHIIWGVPRQTDNRHNIKYPGESTARSGLSVMVREGFVVGHYDLFKVPAWVSIRWTREDFEELSSVKFPRNFGPDPELPTYAQAGDSYNFSTSHMERGHMARHEDNEAWGRDNSDTGCLMSNIVPQHKDMNGEAWNDLEEMHQEIVTTSSIDTVWVISGPIYHNEAPESLIGNGVAVPESTYKVVGWFADDGAFHARGYVVRQGDRLRSDPAHYLTRIRDIEAATGLDFFPELPQARADVIEIPLPNDLWGEDAVDDDGETDSDAVVLFDSLLPNPVGNESINEAVTLRNDGGANVVLDGWLLKDRAGKTWQLFGTLDAGDERTFKRNGQPMALNNSGDTVTLLRPDQTEVDSITYGRAAEGHVIQADDIR